MVWVARLFMIVSSVLVLSLLFGAAPAQSQTSQQTLHQYISDLQKNPDDYALREKIIRHVQTMRPTPAIPEEARRHYVMALTLFKGAKKIEDYGDSIDEFKSALLIAPWWAEANRDLGMACEAAKRYEEAISALKLYIGSGPGEEKVRAARDEIYKIEAMKKLAAREKAESSPQVVSAQGQSRSEDWLKKLDGRRYIMLIGSGVTMVYDVKGTTLVYGSIYETYTEKDRIEIRSREVTIPDPRRIIGGPVVACTVIISEDGARITQRVRYSDGDVRDYVYLWQR